MASLSLPQPGRNWPAWGLPTAGGAALGSDLHDRYLRFLCFSLAAYAILGKGYAYVGVPPLFVGEVLLALGLVVFLRTGSWLAILGSPPCICLVLLMMWAASRMVPFLGTHGIEAVRDSVIVFYGLFAFIVLALLLEKPARLDWLLRRFGGFAWFYGLAAPILLNANSLVGGLLPTWPAAGVPFVFVRLGEAAVHVAGAGAFVLLGFRKVRPYWIVAFLVTLVVVSPSRGAMLACFIPLVFVALVGGALKRMFPALCVGAALFVSAYALGVSVPISGVGERSIGPEQIIHNVESLFGSSKASNLDGTKAWRLHWWRTIEDYALRGSYMWSGKGFGVNLAEADGFTLGDGRGAPPVRAPHNIHYNVLARMGVPGLALWALVLATWFLSLTRAAVEARRLGQPHWEKLFIWIVAYGGSVVIDATFDVAIEGPMLGIWFWCIFGFGCAAVMIFRAPQRMAEGSKGAPLALVPGPVLGR
ncbi:O-antigen ligase family protein [Enterovirga aerilata]|uniref:O-antigen ligase family protein n=1 Tax=Enterovirga aerilata TaxID=2730920 RepID=A0A849I9K2_9HYPH|nr:O-antigen ligase family protein [Enterovirga sp. DB1703]NNM74068.1 O-antigen ligase family protein [Enterovirga sp. DB1703]